MPRYVQDPVTGQWYETDSNGKIIYTRNAPENMEGVLIREYDTGETIDDPSTANDYYRVRNINPKTREGHITLKGRNDRNKAIKTLYNNEELKTQLFGEEIANYNRTKFRKYIKSDAGRSALGGSNKKIININGEVTTRDSIGRRYDDEKYANLANDILNPQKKQTDIEWEKVNSIDGTRSWYTLEKCKTCGPNGNLKWTKHTKSYSLPIYGLKSYSQINKPDIQEYVEYDQIPLMDEEYAVPVQLTPHSKTEIKPGTSTPPISLIRKPKSKTNVKSTTSRKPIPRTRTLDQTRTITWQTFPDGSLVGDKQYSDWKNIE